MTRTLRIQAVPGRGWPGSGVFDRARLALASTMGAAALLAPVLAAAQVITPREYLQRMDGDGDGRVSLAEYVEWMGYAFHGMDLDGDGVLASHELPGGRGGPVTLVQHRARLADRFARQDVDGDGFLDARELAAPPQR